MITIVWNAEGIMPAFPRPWWWRLNHAAWERRLYAMVEAWYQGEAIRKG